MSLRKNKKPEIQQDGPAVNRGLCTSLIPWIPEWRERTNSQKLLRLPTMSKASAQRAQTLEHTPYLESEISLDHTVSSRLQTVTSLKKTKPDQNNTITRNLLPPPKDERSETQTTFWLQFNNRLQSLRKLIQSSLMIEINFVS